MHDVDDPFAALKDRLLDVIAAEKADAAARWTKSSVKNRPRSPSQIALDGERDHARIWSEWLDGSSLAAIARDYPLSIVKRCLAAAPPPIVRDDPRLSGRYYFWIAACKLKSSAGKDLPAIFLRMPRKPTTLAFRKALRAVKADLARVFPGAELETSVMEGVEAHSAERMIKNQDYPAWSFDEGGNIQRLDPEALNPGPQPIARYEVPKLVAGPTLAADFERVLAFVALLMADGTLQFDAVENEWKKLTHTLDAAPTGGLDRTNERLAFLASLSINETLRHRIAEDFRRREIELRYPDFARLAEAVRIRFAPARQVQA